ncbi:hypothetical protein G9A89_017445 [Geosiphon pyriformis]|nr:hypothetical protein G9A89_017445 [Geosiphon pyriformis]
MHRFRKKQDLKKSTQLQPNEKVDSNINIFDNTTGIPNSDSNEFSNLPPSSDFRTSLILPTLTKRFSVLRRGDLPLSSSTSTSISPADTTLNVTKISKSHSGSSPVHESFNITTKPSNKDFKTSSTIPSALGKQLNLEKTKMETEFQVSSNSENILSNSPPPPTTTTTTLPHPLTSPLNKSSTRKAWEKEINVKSLNHENLGVRKRQSGLLGNLAKDRPSPPKTRKSSISKLPGDSLDIKNTPLPIKLPSTITAPKSRSIPIPNRSSSFKRSSLTENDILYSTQQTFGQTKSPFSSSPKMSPVSEVIVTSPLPLSPLDKLSQGLFSLSLRQSIASGKSQSYAIPSKNDLKYSSLNSTKSPSNPQAYSYEDDLASYISNFDNNLPSNLKDHEWDLNSLDQIPYPSPIDISHDQYPSRQLSFSDQSSSLLMGGINPNFSGDRSSTGSSIAKSLQRIRELPPALSKKPSQNLVSSYNVPSKKIISVPYEEEEVEVDYDGEQEEDNENDNGDHDHYYKDQQERENNQENYKGEEKVEIGQDNLILKGPISSSPPLITKSATQRSNRPNKSPPKKPLPPEKSLTEILIASGQADIAHQVMVMRRTLNSGNEEITNPLSVPRFEKPPLRKSKKHIAIKDISTPHLISSSSNVKTIPIVRLDREDDHYSHGSNYSFRRKFSLRDSESSIGKFSKKLKDVFTTDGEATKSPKKPKPTVLDTLSPHSSHENLPKKFISDDNLRHRYITPSKNKDPNSRRAQSIREKGLNDYHNTRQETFNNLTYIVNTNKPVILISEKNKDSNDQSEKQFDPTLTEINESENNPPTLYNNRWVVSDSDLSLKKVLKKSDSSDRLAPLYDIDGIKRHAEMVTKYSSVKKEQKSRTSSQSENSRDSSTCSGVENKNLNYNSFGEEEFSAKEERMSGSETNKSGKLTSSSPPTPPRLSLEIPSRAAALQSTPIIINEQSWPHNKRDTFGTDSLASPSSPCSPSSPVSLYSDTPEGRNSPPPILPRNPLRGSSQQKNSSIVQQKPENQPKQQQESFFRRHHSVKGCKNVNNSDVEDKHQSKESRGSRTSIRLLSLFNNGSIRMSGGGSKRLSKNKQKRTSNSTNSSNQRSSGGSDLNLLKVPTKIGEPEKTPKKLRNKVVRRTIIITKPFLPPLPDEPTEIETVNQANPPENRVASTTKQLPSTINLAHRASRQPSLRKKKINIDGGIHVGSDGRKWYLAKDDDDDVSEEKGSKSERDITDILEKISNQDLMSESSDRKSESSKSDSDNEDENEDHGNGVSSGSSTKFLAVPPKKSSIINRPPTPVPSPGTRKSVMELPYGIPIPPIPTKHDSFLFLKTPMTTKRSSKASMASTISTGSRKRKSMGGKSVHSTYGDSLYDYYDYSDQEGADDEEEAPEQSEVKTQRQSIESVDVDQVTKSNNNLERPKSLINETKGPLRVEGEALEKLEQEQHVELLELDDGSLIWQVVNGLRGEDMTDRYSYFYNAGDEEEYSDSQMWAKELGASDDDDETEEDLKRLNSRISPSDYSQNYSAPLHVPGVQPTQTFFRSPNRTLHQDWTSSAGSTSSYEDGTNIIPRTSVYIAKDVALPRLLEEMTKGLGNVDLGRNVGGYIYGRDLGAAGNANVAGMSVEEKLEQVMRALGVDDKEKISSDD